MTELEHLTKLIESAMYWGADTPEKIAERLIDEGVICPPCKVGGYGVDGKKPPDRAVESREYRKNGK